MPFGEDRSYVFFDDRREVASVRHCVKATPASCLPAFPSPTSYEREARLNRPPG